MAQTSRKRAGRSAIRNQNGSSGSDLYTMITPDSESTEKISSGESSRTTRSRSKGNATGKSGKTASGKSAARETERKSSARSGSTRNQGSKSGSAKSGGKAAAPAEKKNTARTRAASQATARKDPRAAHSANLTVKLPGEKKTAPRTSNRRKKDFPPVRILFLGGINEIGKNLTAYECGDDILLVDCGTSFPDDDMLGIDLVIPDFTYLENNREKVRGVFITHGHEDHIGGLPYLLKTVNCPVYATRLTAGLITNKLTEHGLLESVEMKIIADGDSIQVGCFKVEPIRVNHSIPDAVAFAITTPAGVILQTGDFKIDFTPVSGDVINLARFGELGQKGVLALLCDSTNAERPGSTKTERSVGESFENLFVRAGDRRIIIATFSSNIHRIQQVIDLAQRFGRKVCISGRSMVNVTTTAMQLGYLQVPDGLLVDIDSLSHYSPEELIILTTGSQGEPMSALYRMAMSDHRRLTVGPNDFIIISANPIPGNEKLVSRVVNELMKQGAEVIYESMYEVHVSGHACRDELRILHGLVKPEYFIPVHGEYKHLKKHEQLALEMGMDSANVFIPDIGKVLEFNPKGVYMNATVPAGKVLVDGLGVGDVGSMVLRDRKHLGQDGLIVVTAVVDNATGMLLSGPDIVTRGFVYVPDAEPLMSEAEQTVQQVFMECESKGMKDLNSLKATVRDSLSSLLFRRTKRSPMILVTILAL